MHIVSNFYYFIYKICYNSNFDILLKNFWTLISKFDLCTINIITNRNDTRIGLGRDTLIPFQSHLLHFIFQTHHKPILGRVQFKVTSTVQGNEGSSLDKEVHQALLTHQHCTMTKMEPLQAKEPQSHQKSKHVLRCYHLIWEIINRGEVRIERVHNDQNIVDRLTKPLSQVKCDSNVLIYGIRYKND